jgi:OOP family OmpA-OmpF porin
VLLLSFPVLAQKKKGGLKGNGNGSRNSIEFNFGSSNAVRPYTLGYRSGTVGLFHADLSARFMMNDRFGYKLTFGFDNITNAKDGSSLSFKSQYLRVTAQAVIDMGVLLNFKDFTRKFTILVHGGPGVSYLMNAQGKSGNMLNFTAGVVPQLKISERFRIHLDFTRVRHVYQQVTFDLNSKHDELGFDGLIVNASLGFSIYFGN